MPLPPVGGFGLAGDADVSDAGLTEDEAVEETEPELLVDTNGGMARTGTVAAAAAAELLRLTTPLYGAGVEDVEADGSKPLEVLML